jgi:beta-glucanase (GH16 family)
MMSTLGTRVSAVCAAGASILAHVATPTLASETVVQQVDERTLKVGDSVYKLQWRDEFDYADAELDQHWESQNGPSTHILCSRWRENVSVADGTLKLTNRKEKRGGQEWTSGSIWTRKQFKYGFFECRYRYAAAEGTNNSFWIMTRDKQPGTPFEIDINEGHYPNEINTNIHYWTDVVGGKRQNHRSASRTFPLGVRTDHVLQLERPVTATKVRLLSKQTGVLAVSEFQVLSKEKPADAVGGLPALDLARGDGVKVSVSGNLKPEEQTADFAVDDKPDTAWISQREGEKWIEIDLGDAIEIGAVRFKSGAPVAGSQERKHPVNSYTLQYEADGRWVDMTQYDVASGEVNLARDFHTYALEWTETELVFYFNGKVIRREKNTGSHREAPVWLSLAIIPWAGRITDSIDGTFMEVDYVRVYERDSGKSD